MTYLYWKYIVRVRRFVNTIVVQIDNESLEKEMALWWEPMEIYVADGSWQRQNNIEAGRLLSDDDEHYTSVLRDEVWQCQYWRAGEKGVIVWRTHRLFSTGSAAVCIWNACQRAQYLVRRSRQWMASLLAFVFWLHVQARIECVLWFRSKWAIKLTIFKDVVFYHNTFCTIDTVLFLQ